MATDTLPKLATFETWAVIDQNNKLLSTRPTEDDADECARTMLTRYSPAHGGWVHDGDPQAVMRVVRLVVDPAQTVATAKDEEE
jgi:uncharacterized protein YcsI (UPF0317 family)